MSSHTPTPWKLDTSIRGLAEITDQTGATIAVIESDTYRMGDAAENLANAEMIVRAVNSHAALLAALEETLLCLKAWSDGRGPHDATTDVVNRAEAALAQAKA
jgi:hypothetical protein